MPKRTQQLFADIGAIGLIIGALLVLTHPQWVGYETSGNGNQETAAIANAIAASAPVIQPAAASSTAATTTPRKIAAKPTVKSAPITQMVPPASPKTPESRLQVPMPDPSAAPPAATATGSFSIARIPNPYPFPPKTFDVINNESRLALVNILCTPRNGSLRPISASGVIIDPRGVILTNAHVAQYLLLSGDPAVDLSCTIRAGSPAYPAWSAEVLFMPPSWIKTHASDITQARPTGTGEYDYALLRITGSISGQPLPAEFPYIPVDAREAIAFTDDEVLVASYPAEFVGGIATQMNLYPVSSMTGIKKMLTFDDKTVDVISLGGVIGAQSGSSGGAVVNAWGRLVGLISTTSEGPTTAERDLHAITLSYINRNILSESDLDLPSILEGDLAKEADSFNTIAAPALRKLLIDQIKSR